MLIPGREITENSFVMLQLHELGQKNRRTAEGLIFFRGVIDGNVVYRLYRFQITHDYWINKRNKLKRVTYKGSLWIIPFYDAWWVGKKDLSNFPDQQNTFRNQPCWSMKKRSYERQVIVLYLIRYQIFIEMFVK